MERQEAEREEHGKGVRRPRSDAARRTRPQSGLVSSAPAPDVHPGSHPSHDSYRERIDHPSSAHERRPGEKFVDVRDPFSSFVEFRSLQFHRDGPGFSSRYLHCLGLAVCLDFMVAMVTL